jgi:hypothetical protein
MTMAKTAMKELNPELLTSDSKMDVLRSFVESHRKLVPLDKEDVVKDFLELSQLAFCEKYDKPEPAPDDDDIPF